MHYGGITGKPMTTSSNGNIFRFTGHLCEKLSTDHRWIPCTKASGADMFSLICAWINEWAHNREAGDLSHHRAHYDVIVTQLLFSIVCSSYLQQIAKRHITGHL